MVRELTVERASTEAARRKAIFRGEHAVPLAQALWPITIRQPTKTVPCGHQRPLTSHLRRLRVEPSRMRPMRSAGTVAGVHELSCGLNPCSRRARGRIT